MVNRYLYLWKTRATPAPCWTNACSVGPTWSRCCGQVATGRRDERGSERRATCIQTNIPCTILNAIQQAQEMKEDGWGRGLTVGSWVQGINPQRGLTGGHGKGKITLTRTPALLLSTSIDSTGFIRLALHCYRGSGVSIVPLSLFRQHRAPWPADRSCRHNHGQGFLCDACTDYRRYCELTLNPPQTVQRK